MMGEFIKSSFLFECPECHQQVYLEFESTVSHRWCDDSIPDEELDDSEIIYRLNNEEARTVRCPECEESWEEL